MIRQTEDDKGFRAALHRLGGVAALVVLLAATTACGSDGPSDVGGNGGSGDTGSSLGPTLTVKIEFAGEATVNGSSTALAPTNNGQDFKTCADYAKGGVDGDKTYYVVPRDIKDPIDGQTVFVGAMVEDYTGPGTYGMDTLTDVGSPPGISVNGQLYLQQSNSSAQVVTDAAGGGTWTFTALSIRDSYGKFSQGITGKIGWTCSNG
jgi:hypothetical protein